MLRAVHPSRYAHILCSTGLAFHPTQPLLAASLHNGSVQLWNYRMGVLVDRFEEHEGASYAHLVRVLEVTCGRRSRSGCCHPP